MLCSDLDDMEDDDAYRFGGPLYDRRNNNNNNNNSGSSSPPLLYDNNQRRGGLSKKNRNGSTSTSTGTTPPPLYDKRSPPTTILTQSTQPKKHSSQLKKHPTRPPHPLYRNKSPSSSSAAANDDTMMAASITTATTTSSIIDFEEQIKADDYLFEQQLEDQMSSLQLQHHPLDHISMSLTHQHHHQHQPSYQQQHHQHQPYDFQYGVQSTDIAQRVNFRTEDDNGRPGIGLQLEVPDSSTIFSSSSFSIADNDNNINNGNDDNMEMMLDPQVAALLGYPLPAADSTTSSLITTVNNPVMVSNGTNIMYHKNINHSNSNNGRLNNDSSSSPTNITMTSNNGIASPSRVVDPYSKSPSPSPNSHHHQQPHLASVGLDDPLHSLLFDDDPSLNSADYVSIHTAMPALSFAVITILIIIIVITIIIIITTINIIIFINYSSITFSMIT
jgi:hypothetical protein